MEAQMEIETLFVSVDLNDPDVALMISMGRQPSLEPEVTEAIKCLQDALGVSAPWLYLTGGRAYTPRIYLVDSEPVLRWGDSRISMDTLLTHGTLFPDLVGNELVLQYTLKIDEGHEAVFNLRCATQKDLKLNEAVVKVRRSMLSLKSFLASEGSMIPFLERHREEFAFPLDVTVLGVHSKEMKDWNDGRGPQASILVLVDVGGTRYLVKANYKTGTILSSTLLKESIYAQGVVDLGKTRLNLVGVTITEDCFKLPF